MSEWKKLAYETDVILKTLVTAAGDIIYASAPNTPAALPIGDAGDILQTVGGVPAWVDPATIAVEHHASTHEHDGDDVVSLDELGAPDAAVAFAGYQATDLILHEAASAPTAKVGKIYFDTTGGDLHAYLCTDEGA
jgi:hypothetical protein